jgi:isocitrate dehydrogenase
MCGRPGRNLLELDARIGQSKAAPRQVAELAEVQGKPVDIDSYYMADAAKVKAAMRPSATFNAALAAARG